jgi:hypothetical protein
MTMTNAERQKRFRERTLSKARANENELIEELRKIFVEQHKKDHRTSSVLAGYIEDEEARFVERIMTGGLSRDQGWKVAKLLYRMLTGIKEKDIPDSLNKLEGCWAGDKATGVKPAIRPRTEPYK